VPADCATSLDGADQTAARIRCEFRVNARQPWRGPESGTGQLRDTWTQLAGRASVDNLEVRGVRLRPRDEAKALT
jgi:hypothetical protein